MGDLSNSELCWDEFRDWAEDNGIVFDRGGDWKPWWDCWETAARAVRLAISEESGTDETTEDS